ncbi:MAG: DUF5691 domain-containing protein [Polaromonas sp.]|nr:DUF5691 domain-containing protein [Polaromonas sp.]
MSETNASYWQTLLPAAMVGTDKMAFSSPALSGPVGALLAQIQAQATSPTLALLQTAGVLAVCERAARQGTARATSATDVAPDTAAAPAPDAAAPGTTPAANTAAPGGTPAANIAAPETAPALASKSLQISLRWALTDAPLRLQIELLQRLSAAGLRLPASLLPLALEAGQRNVALRPALLAVHGERGRWLAGKNRYWRYAEGAAADAPLETRWSDGSLAQRAQLLHNERQRDPASARERLKTALPDLPAKDRAELATVLIEGLSMDDEALLTALCKDRGADVRQTARALLVQLPDSAATQRAIARLQPCLEKQSTLKSLLGEKWKIDAPQAAADDWKTDGLEAERPKGESLGERAWWLYQLARQVPLAWWVEHTGMEAAALLQWARKSDWIEALALAWLEVLKTAPDAAWCRAFLDHWPGKAAHENPATVLALLPPAQREPYWTQTLQDISAAKSAHFNDVASQMIQACQPGEHVSEALSLLLLQKLPLYLRKSYLRMPQDELCCVLHPAVLPTLLDTAALERLAPAPDDSKTDSLAHVLQSSLQVIAARQAFATLTPASTASSNPINSPAL